MKECLVPARGPSKPSARSRRMKSRRLQGVHRLMNRLPVEINAGDHGQRVGQFHSEEYPIFQSGAQVAGALGKRRGKRDYARTGRNPSAIGAVVELVIHRLCHRPVEVFGQNVHGKAASTSSISQRAEFYAAPLSALSTVFGNRSI